ncbi:MAG: hypothetical protein JNL74_18090, partial [Fibrobacteres bacterium]|nr:hypothetical protein [Fibrobacterota bacterium]
MIKKLSLTAAFIAVAFMIAGCAKTRKAGGQMDTPEVHTEQGMKYFEGGEINKAEEEFNLAISLDKKFAPAYAGRALVYGDRGRN